jgi:hypothetical protein
LYTSNPIVTTNPIGLSDSYRFIFLPYRFYQQAARVVDAGSAASDALIGAGAGSSAGQELDLQDDSLRPNYNEQDFEVELDSPFVLTTHLSF